MNEFINWWQGLILGLIQGITEYLPVSSSGHLAIAQLLFGLHLPLSVDVLLHFATLIPTIWIFRKKLASLLGSFAKIVTTKNFASLNPSTKRDGRYISLILIVTACTFVLAFPQKNLNLKSQPILIGLAFLGTALLLCMQQLFLRKQRNASFLSNWPRDIFFAICMGLVQGIAALPGISRSGVTISVALLLGLQRREAGEFSFIISIPVIVGALLFDYRELLDIAEVSGVFTIILGFVAACISGFFALRLLLSLLNSGKLYWFSIYLFALGIFTLWYLV